MYTRRKIFSVAVDTEGAEKLFSVSDTVLEQKEFGSRKRKAKRRAAAKEHNEVMHANAANNKIEKAAEVVKKGTESAEIVDAQLNNANRLAKGTPVQEEIAKKAEEIAKENTSLKTNTKRVVNKANKAVKEGARKAMKFTKAHPGAVALGATGLAAAGVVGSMVAKKNKEEKRKVFSVAKDENGEEKMFSVCDIILEDQREYAQKEKEDEDKNKKDKKVLDKALAGTAGVASGVAVGSELMARRAAKQADARVTDRLLKVRSINDLQHLNLIKEYEKAAKYKSMARNAAPVAIVSGLTYGSVKLARHLKNKKKNKDKE